MDYYLGRLSARVIPDEPGFGEAQWVVSEDLNTEHPLDDFISIDPDEGYLWDACYHFMEHIY